MSGEVQLPEALPPDLRDELLKRLPYVAEKLTRYSLNASGDVVRFELRDATDTEALLVSQRIRSVAEKLRAGFREGSKRTLLRRASEAKYRADPHPVLLQRGELFRFGRGRFGLGPSIAALVRRLDDLVVQTFAEFEPAAYQFPSLIGGDVLDRCRYLRNFPSSLTLVTHLREDLDLLQEFARTAQWSNDAVEFSVGAQSKVECLLSPSVCFHWYAWLSGADLSSPFRSITALGKCFRYESSALEGLERLWDFSMREVVFVGSPEFVRKRRDRCIELAGDLLDRLGLGFEIATATDPFFVDSYAVQAAFQQGFELKHELLADLPYSGRQLAVGSVNFHQDFFGRSFGIKALGEHAETACIGIGLERLAIAIVAQHGPDPTGWPGLVASHG
jgi:seryl-tRNA synthetase